MRNIMLVLLALSVALAAGCGKKEVKEDKKVTETKTTETKPAEVKKAAPTIAEVVASKPELKKLNAAVNAAGLGDALKGAGPFTLFAPTDMAFNALGAGKFEELAQPVNKAKLANILKFHVLNGKVMAADAKTMGAKTLQGSPVSIEVKDGKVFYGGAPVIKTDIVAGNGVIHYISKVAMPPAQ